MPSKIITCVCKSRLIAVLARICGKSRLKKESQHSQMQITNHAKESSYRRWCATIVKEIGRCSD